MKRLSLVLVLALFPLLVHAAPGGDEGVPWSFIGHQTLNFVAVCLLLYFLLRNKVRTHFAERQQNFTELISKAERAKQAADESRREIAERLNRLQATADEDLKKARQEAEGMKQKILEEARQMAKQLEADAYKNVSIELERAKLSLRQDLLRASLEETRNILKSKLSGNEQKRLKDEFVEKIQVVR